MPIKPLRLKQHDLQPYYRFSVSGVNLTGATIVCTMIDAGGSKKINRQSAGIVVTDAVAGEAEYRWQAGDTDTIGTYRIEFEITPQSGGKFTVPNDEPAVVFVGSDLDGV
jgi:hypothetical protein